MDQEANGDGGDHRPDTTPDDEQRRRGDNRGEGPGHDARVRGGGAVDGVESRGRDVSGAGWACGRRDRDRTEREATVGGEGRRRHRRGVSESEATGTAGGNDDAGRDRTARAKRRWGRGSNDDEDRDPKPPQRGTAIDDCSAERSNRRGTSEARRGRWRWKVERKLDPPGLP
ncbi:hypothetical protein [Halorubrum ezzemoulense]|uniref:hypothetical protein n=1 Tax=Halorubrum ezzemoulense TaxID=337243 RepID=UPI00232F456D|nr:hypothetical protein [Halorubrum ezzemoulense]MDB2250095.1 hypothetical protein [Halorubrum ezzemoulense]